jgi:sulfide:quinone oxidoreductase
VDARTLATGDPDVYAVGDVNAIPIPSGKMLPKAGVFAHAQADVVARNIVAAWTGKAPSAAFDGTGACFIETGGGKAGYGAGDFYAAPVPRMTLRLPARLWHWGKVWFERRWLSRWF